MSEYSVTFARSARKELELLEPRLIRRIMSKIEALAHDPHPRGSRKLQGEYNLWRIRLGDFRVVYSVLDDERCVDIVRIRHRKDVYQ